MAFPALAAVALACCLVAAAVARAWAWRRAPRFGLGRAPLPKGGLGLPLLGQSLELFRDFNSDPDNFWRSRLARYGKGERLLKTHLFGSPTIMVLSADMMRAILLGGGTKEESFGPGWPKGAMRLAGGQSFLAVMGEDYKRLRRLASTSVNSPSTLSRVISYMEDITLQALHRWSLMGKIVLIDELLELTFDSIASLIVSKLPTKEIKEFCKEFQYVNAGLRALPFNIPGFAYHKALKGRKSIVKRIQGYIEIRLAQPNVAHDDVLESLMNLCDEQGKKLSYDEIIDCVVTFLLAGHESSAHTAMWIMIFLSKNPEKLQKLLEEQTKIMAHKSPTKGLSVSDYRGMRYLYSVIDEALRIVNISPFTFRKTLSTIEINGYTIPKDWKLAFWFRALHMNEEIFPEPYEFKPERWQDINLKAGMYAPFGLGARSCIGMDLAKLELAVLVHNLVLNYRWELINPDCKVVYLPRAKPTDGCPVVIHPR